MFCGGVANAVSLQIFHILGLKASARYAKVQLRS